MRGGPGFCLINFYFWRLIMSDSTPVASYGASLFLPKTQFPLRAGHAERDAHWRADLGKNNGYMPSPAPTFVLHDGPPYANGNLHLGHALNKVLKDLVARSRVMAGGRVDFTPGWDCHGLPIEWKVEESYRDQGVSKSDVSVLDFRQSCRDYASQWVDTQKDQFQELGVAAAWDKPYLTMDFSSQAKVAREFMHVVMSGLLYQKSRPMMWSPVEQTVLAEAEVEYHPYTSTSAWVGFRAQSGPLSGCLLLAWTTTPWTLSASSGLAFSQTLDYGLYERQTESGETVSLVFAKSQYDAVSAALKEELTFKRDVSHQDLSSTTLSHPLSSVDHYWEEMVLGCWAGDHVQGGTGSGLVHTAPAHGPDDFAFGQSLGLPLHDVLDDAGCLVSHLPVFGGLPVLNLPVAGSKKKDKRDGKKNNRQSHERDHVRKDGTVHSSLLGDAPSLGCSSPLENSFPCQDSSSSQGVTSQPAFAGVEVLGNANDAVLSSLARAGLLMAREKHTHSYPHSWRSKSPVVFKTTPQWFVSLDTPFDVKEGKDGEQHRKRKHNARDSKQDNRSQRDKDTQNNHETNEKHPFNQSSDGNNSSDSNDSDAKGHSQYLQSTVLESTTLRQRAVNALDNVVFTPHHGKEKLLGMVQSRPDWVLSRQRQWGVPLTLFTRKDKKPNEAGYLLQDECVNVRVYEDFCQHGANAWYQEGAKARYLGDDYAPDDYEQCFDVLDVWFESGCSHVLANLDAPADLCLEGVDQHRGWFQSSLLHSVLRFDRAPYKHVLTHGFVLDAKGRKMSKSEGNVSTPQDVLKDCGVDGLRLWVAMGDYTKDLKLSKDSLSGARDTYKKLRNTLRYLLGVLGDDTYAQSARSFHYHAPDHYAPDGSGVHQGTYQDTYQDPHPDMTPACASTDPFPSSFLRPSLSSLSSSSFCLSKNGEVKESSLPFKSLPLLERWLLDRLHSTNEKVKSDYASLSFGSAVSTMHEFCAQTLSALYCEARKDALYCDSQTSHERQCALYALSLCLDVCLSWMSPVMVLCAHEALMARYPQGGQVRFLSLHAWCDDEARAAMEPVLGLKSDVSTLLAQTKTKPGRAVLRLDGEKPSLDANTLALVFGAARVDFSHSHHPMQTKSYQDSLSVLDKASLAHQGRVALVFAHDAACPRCWVGQEEDSLCARCASVMREHEDKDEGE